MIRTWVVSVLLRKELLEVVRDRRTLFLMVFLPLLLYPVIFVVAGQAAVHQTHKIQSEQVRVAVFGAPIPAGLSERVRPADALEFVTGNDAEDPEQALQVDGVVAVLAFEEGLAQHLESEQTAPVRLLFDETSETSMRAQQQVQSLLAAWSETLVQERLQGHGLPPHVVHPFDLDVENVAPPEKVGGHLLGQTVPLLLVMMIVLGAFYPAIEVTAGEKERGTLQTLLCAPIAPLEIVTAKFLSVFTVATVTGLANILSLALLFGMVVLMPGEMSDAIDLTVSTPTVLWTLLIAVLISLMFSAIMMTVAVLARTFKEAQTYMTPVYLVAILPVMIAQLPGMSLTPAVQLVPGLNQALLLREILSGTIDYQHIFIVATASIVYTFSALILAAGIFEREAILLGEVGFVGLFERGSSRPRVVRPRFGESLGMYALVFILLFYVGSLSQVWHLLGGILLSQWVLIAGSLLLFLRLRGYDLRDSLGLHRPRLRTLGAAFLMGVSAWYPLVALTRVESGTPSPQNEALEKAFEQLLGGEQSLLLILFVIALSPAVCEELLFRGLIMRSMVGRFRTRTVVVVTALLFGALHLYASRFVPTTVLGVLCAFLALRGHSILPAMLFHFLNNGTAVVLARFQWSLPGITEPGPLDTTQAGTAAFLLLTGAWLLWGGRPTESVSTA